MEDYRSISLTPKVVSLAPPPCICKSGTDRVLSMRTVRRRVFKRVDPFVPSLVGRRLLYPKVHTHTYGTRPRPGPHSLRPGTLHFFSSSSARGDEEFQRLKSNQEWLTS